MIVLFYVHINIMRQILLSLFFITLVGCKEVVEYKSDPVTVTAPRTEVSNFETNDSTYLKINIQNENYKISFLNEDLFVDNIHGIDSFLQKNSQSIVREKVIVTGFNNTEKDKDFIGILSKYGVSKFRVNMP
jgi:hypothetical protein